MLRFLSRENIKVCIFTAVKIKVFIFSWLWNIYIISSPEPKAPRWANSIPVTPSSVRPSSLNIFKHLLLWNYWANWTKTSYGDSLGWGNKSLFKWSWSHDQDGRHPHTPIYGKNPLKIFFSRTRSWWPWDLVCSIGDVGPTKFVQMMILGWPWPT